MYKRYIKRPLDFFLALIAVIILLPVYLILSIIVTLKMGRPVIFKQSRMGKDEKEFVLYKFRSMTNDKDEYGNLLPENERLTKFGIKLRSSSLDELPELFNILKGDMSFVGPRPQPMYYQPYYTQEERIAHTVRGGLIPPDSLGKEVQSSWETQLEYETYYAENVSFMLDVRIILCTFSILIKRIKTDYGADDRPKLNEYRKDWIIAEEERKSEKV